MNITTNHHWRNFLYGYELPESVRADFDYLDDDEFATHEFIKYQGVYYDDSEFMDCALEYWHAYHADTYFSAILIRYSADGEQYQVGLAVS